MEGSSWEFPLLILETCADWAHDVTCPRTLSLRQFHSPDSISGKCLAGNKAAPGYFRREVNSRERPNNSPLRTWHGGSLIHDLLLLAGFLIPWDFRLVTFFFPAAFSSTSRRHSRTFCLCFLALLLFTVCAMLGPLMFTFLLALGASISTITLVGDSFQMPENIWGLVESAGITMFWLYLSPSIKVTVCFVTSRTLYGPCAWHGPPCHLGILLYAHWTCSFACIVPGVHFLLPNFLLKFCRAVLKLFSCLWKYSLDGLILMPE